MLYLIHDQKMSSFVRDTAIIKLKYRDKRQSRGVRYDQVKLEGSQAKIELRA